MFAQKPGNYRFLQLTIILVVVSAVVLIGTKDLLAEYCQDECPEHCNEENQSCNGCVRCLPSIVMLAADVGTGAQWYGAYSWDIAATSFAREPLLAEGIDHPPKIA
jgi:hypothetical protein